MQNSRKILGHPPIGRSSLGLRRGSCGDRSFMQTKRLVAPQLSNLLWREDWPPKRQKGSKDTFSEEMRDPTRPELVRPPANTELSGVGLSTAQRTNPLTVIVRDASYPESVLSLEQFELFRETTLHVLDKEPASNWQDLKPPSEGKNYLFMPDYLQGKLSRAGGTCHGNGEAGSFLIGCIRPNHYPYQLASQQKRFCGSAEKHSCDAHRHLTYP